MVTAAVIEDLICLTRFLSQISLRNLRRLDCYANRDPLRLKTLSPGHRREECNLAGARYRRVWLDVGVVDRRADHPRRLEGVGVSVAARRKPADQIAYRAHAGGWLDGFLCDPDPFPDPGKKFGVHFSSSLLRAMMPAR